MFGPYNAAITNQISSMSIVTNVPDEDYSLKLVSGDKTKNVTFIRLKGPEAEQGVQQVYFLFQNLTTLLGMTVE